MPAGTLDVSAPRRRLPPVLHFSLTARVVAVAALVGAALVALSAVALFGNARSAVRVETLAGQRLARDYALATLGALLRDHDPATAVRLLPGVLTGPRHARIHVIDSRNAIAEVAERGRAEAAAPAWFAALLRPPPREMVIPVHADGRTFARVVITPDPAAEIDEVWAGVRTLGPLALGAYVLFVALLGVLVRRTLRPLSAMAAAFDRLEAGDYAARIGPVDVPELASLAEGFDRLGRALQTAFAEKDALARSLLDVADDERKAIALELHDEYGPCLFGLRVEARALLAAAERRGDGAGAESARAVAALAEQIQRANRALLDRLRPMQLGELPLAQVLDDLVGGMIALGGDLAWTVKIADSLPEVDEAAGLTIYRVAQEAITNALRHAGAGAIAVAVASLPGRPDVVEIVVEDDGIGLPAPRRDGMGLRGMRERTAAVGGSLSLRGRAGGGTVVRATVPLRPRAAAEDDARAVA